MGRQVEFSAFEALSVLWSGFEPWQKVVIPVVLVMAVGMAAYRGFVERKDPEVKEAKRSGPFAYFGLGNDDLKLFLVGGGLFILMIVAAQFLVAI
ncbi:hypothetical protein [Alcanivorax sediminis]|uniref:Uncharacterized protein n=1 Tax=Alcanivorax sediminis TaxID=2663008 RepID=A0A6N7LZX9_9GAMM|nr:hypothetical protein [Alcanivorax sediminis]MQX54675.1 hypothetical protein [Alcanivorax sediminis]